MLAFCSRRNQLMLIRHILFEFIQRTMDFRDCIIFRRGNYQHVQHISFICAVTQIASSFVSSFFVVVHFSKLFHVSFFITRSMFTQFFLVSCGKMAFWRKKKGRKRVSRLCKHINVLKSISMLKKKNEQQKGKINTTCACIIFGLEFIYDLQNLDDDFFLALTLIPIGETDATCICTSFHVIQLKHYEKLTKQLMN